MTRLLHLVTGCILMGAGAFADEPAPIPSNSRPSGRVYEAMSMHGVWYTRDIYLALYADPELLEYFAGIPSDLIVLPVYSPSPLHFRRGRFDFVSTGFILRSRSERELLKAIAAPEGWVASHEDSSRFLGLQWKLTSQIAEYAAGTRLQLRRRN